MLVNIQEIKTKRMCVFVYMYVSMSAHVYVCETTKIHSSYTIS